MPDPRGLTDDDLMAALLEHGVTAGPIVASTRAVYEKKLRKLLQSDGHGRLNGVEPGVMYSDSEEEEEEDDEESGSEGEERNKKSESAQPGSRQLDMSTLNQDTMKNQSLYYTPKASTYNWEIKEPVKDTFRDKLPNTNATPTRIYATCRRPIKGAAGRPVQYTYPDTPASPTTLERQEVERRLVPVQIQILVFVTVVCLLYLIYVCVEDDSFSTFVALLDSLNQGSESEEGLSLQAQIREAPALSELE